MLHRPAAVKTPTARHSIWVVHKSSSNVYWPRTNFKTKGNCYTFTFFFTGNMLQEDVTGQCYNRLRPSCLKHKTSRKPSPPRKFRMAEKPITLPPPTHPKPASVNLSTWTCGLIRIYATQCFTVFPTRSTDFTLTKFHLKETCSFLTHRTQLIRTVGGHSLGLHIPGGTFEVLCGILSPYAVNLCISLAGLVNTCPGGGGGCQKKQKKQKR